MMFLIFSGHEPRHIFKGDNWNIEAVAKTDKTGGLFAGVNIEDTCVVCWLICDDANAVSTQAGEPDNDIGSKMLMNFKEAPIVHNHLNGFFDVIGLIRAIWNQGVEPRIRAQWVIFRDCRRWVFHVVLWNVRQQF